MQNANKYPKIRKMRFLGFRHEQSFVLLTFGKNLSTYLRARISTIVYMKSNLVEVFLAHISQKIGCGIQTNKINTIWVWLVITFKMNLLERQI